MRSFIAFKREFFYDNFFLSRITPLARLFTLLVKPVRGFGRRELLNVVCLSKSNEFDWRRKSLGESFYVVGLFFSGFLEPFKIELETKQHMKLSSMSIVDNRLRSSWRRFFVIREWKIVIFRLRKQHLLASIMLWIPSSTTNSILGKTWKMLCVGAEKCKKRIAAER